MVRYLSFLANPEMCGGIHISGGLYKIYIPTEIPRVVRFT